METVLTEISRTHEEIRILLAKISTARPTDWNDVETLYLKLVGHHTAEEEVLFILVAKTDEKAEALIKLLRREHTESETGIKAFLDAGSVDYRRFALLHGLLTEHMEEEEAHFFRKSRKAMTKKQLQDAIGPFEITEMKVKKKAENDLPKR